MSSIALVCGYAVMIAGVFVIAAWCLFEGTNYLFRTGKNFRMWKRMAFNPRIQQVLREEMKDLLKKEAE